jgi:phage tail sheath protein FI
MAELTFKSPGVSTREIDLSGPANVTPQGIPAGVVGTAQKGRAFVPVTVATYQDFVAEFGESDGEKFGPLAMYEWLQNARAGTYIRVLGVGNGTKRLDDGTANSGKVSYAGFVVGSKQVQPTGDLGENEYAGSAQAGYNGELGRTYFLGCLMSESNGSTYLSDAGITGKDSMPIVRGVLMVASGVIASLSSSFSTNNSPNNTLVSSGSFTSDTVSGDAGAHLGTVDINDGRSDFILFLNGLEPTDRHSNVITASFDPNSAQYFARVLNTDPQKMEEAGHYLYTSWDVYPSYAVVTSSGQQTGSPAGVGLIEAAFLLTGSQLHNSGTTTLPNYEGFEDRYSTAFSPFVVSQKFGGKPKNLFRFHALDDGRSANDLFKITIENISATKNENSPYGTFDVLIRSFYDTDENPVVFESFRSLSLDPASDRYIARIIGDQHIYYDFDQKRGAQKLRVEGSYPNASKYVRVEMDADVDTMSIDSTALPLGFRGPHFLLTSGTDSSGNAPLLGYVTGTLDHGIDVTNLQAAQVAPVPYRVNIGKGTGISRRVNAALTWGVQFEMQSSLPDPNGNVGPDLSRVSYTQYFPMYHTNFRNVMIGDTAGAVADGGMVLDSDAFQNNLFSLENVQVATSSADKPDDRRWEIASYRRNGVKLTALTASDGTVYTDSNTRFLDPVKDFSHLPSRKYLKFSFFMQGGFDGVNIFDHQKSRLSDIAARREFDSIQGQGGIDGPTLNAYRKAIDVMSEKSDVDIQLLAVPGIRHSSVTDYAIAAVENRFDALYIMDVEEKDQTDEFITGSLSIQRPSVQYTINEFANRNLDTSFAAAYYPDVVMQDPATLTNVVIPPSVAVLGAFALNDTVAHPWFAPAGFSRGALPRVLETQVKLNRTNLDDLYEVDINPLTSFADTNGVVVFGQKTLLAAQSALDRVNVRRLLIEVRRRVRRIANTFIFEPNRESTLSRFSTAVNPALQQIQAQRGLDRYRVQIDTTTTTQADVENNTIRGKIYLQPTRSLEFISLDFVVTNQGAVV